MDSLKLYIVWFKSENGITDNSEDFGFVHAYNEIEAREKFHINNEAAITDIHIVK